MSASACCRQLTQVGARSRSNHDSHLAFHLLNRSSWGAERGCTRDDPCCAAVADGRRTKPQVTVAPNSDAGHCGRSGLMERARKAAGLATEPTLIATTIRAGGVSWKCLN